MTNLPHSRHRQRSHSSARSCSASPGRGRVGQQFFRTAQNALNPRLEQLLDKVEPDVKDDWQLLAVEGGRIYEVTADKGIIEARKTRGGAYGAIGSGASVALGSLYGRHQDEPDLMVALEAAQEHIVNVRGPFTILSVEWK